MGGGAGKRGGVRGEAWVGGGAGASGGCVCGGGLSPLTALPRGERQSLLGEVAPDGGRGEAEHSHAGARGHGPRKAPEPDRDTGRTPAPNAHRRALRVVRGDLRLRYVSRPRGRAARPRPSVTEGPRSSVPAARGAGRAAASRAGPAHALQRPPSPSEFFWFEEMLWQVTFRHRTLRQRELQTCDLGRRESGDGQA